MWEQTAGSPPRATHSALGARRCAPRALRACVPGRPGRRSVPLAAIAASRYALGADGVGPGLRARAPIRQPSRGLALRARRRWRRRCTPERLHLLPPDNARVASWWWGGRRRRALCADRDAWCNARFALLPRGRVGRGVSDIIMHERAGQRLRATAACAVRVGAACASATGAPYPQARPPPRTLSARARLHAAGEGRHDGHDDLNVAS